MNYEDALLRELKQYIDDNWIKPSSGADTEASHVPSVTKGAEIPERCMLKEKI